MITNLLNELRLHTESRVRRGDVYGAVKRLSDACEADMESFTEVRLTQDDLAKLRDVLGAATAALGRTS